MSIAYFMAFSFSRMIVHPGDERATPEWTATFQAVRRDCRRRLPGWGADAVQRITTGPSRSTQRAPEPQLRTYSSRHPPPDLVNELFLVRGGRPRLLLCAFQK